MYHSNNSLTGSPSFTIRTRRLDDGRFAAEAPFIEGMREVEAPTESEAVREMQSKLQEWLLTGAPKMSR